MLGAVLLADATATELGSWIIPAVFILGGVAAMVHIGRGVKEMFKGEPRPTRDQEYVTRAEFTEKFAELKASIEKFASREEFASLTKTAERLADDTQRRFHDLANKLEPINNKVAAMEIGYSFVKASIDQANAQSTDTCKAVARLVSLIETKQQVAEKAA